MYNRYVPQPDGSFQRRQQQEQQPQPRQQSQSQRKPEKDNCDNRPVREPQKQPNPDNCKDDAQERSQPCREEHRRSHGSVGGFFSQILPKDFDTGDLLIVLLLLLMAADCDEGQNTALLTLGLYLFM